MPADTMTTSPPSEPLYLRVNNRNMASRAFNALRLENHQARLTETSQAQSPPSPPASTTPATAAQAEEDGFGFDDLLDIVNPLHHIPIVSTLYREITDDKIDTTARVAGGAVYGGVPGALSAVADEIFKEISGKNLGDHIASWLFGDEETPAQLAEAAPTPSSSGKLLMEPVTLSVPATLSRVPAPSSADMVTPHNSGGIQLSSAYLNSPSPPETPAPSQQAQKPELPPLQDRISDPKAAWANKPSLSPSAFNSLLESFDTTPAQTTALAAKTADKSRPTKLDPKLIQASSMSNYSQGGSNSQTPIGDLMDKISSGLEKYDQAKTQAFAGNGLQPIERARRTY